MNNKNDWYICPLTNIVFLKYNFLVMRKVRYSFASLVLVAVFCAVSAVVNAQIYINPVGRSYGWPPNSNVAPASLQLDPYSEVNALKIGGTTSAWMKVDTINISSRGVSLFNKTSLLGSYEYTHNGNKFGQLELASLDLTDETKDIELIAGQTLTIDASVDNNGANWGNATIFLDWDGNGSFDDHDPYLYNKYGASSLTNIEYRGDPLSTVVSYKWDIPVPITFTKERYVRIRLRLDEAVVESYWMKQTAINGHNGHTLGIPECTQVQVSETNYQNFWPMCSFRFLPSARGIKGSTLDFLVKVVPDPYATAMQEMETVVGAGNVGSTCQSTEGTAITDAAGFNAFMSATEDNYYLANDITLTSLPVSQTTFSGTFDGNGHTITFSSAATATFNGTSKDACFFPYGTTDAEISTNLFTKFETEANPTIDMTNYPLRAIAGGFCGVLANGGSIKNVKLVYAADATYKNNATEAPIFGLIAGINKGHIENVSIDIQAGKTVMLQNAGSPTASAFGGITGVLYLGIVKHCAVNIDGTLKHEAASAMQETLTSAFIGRLQAGVVSNVKFSGSGTMYANSAAVANVRNYMGGIAGMTNTPQGEFCGNQDFDKQLKSWGYDNGTVSPDVNNVILSYTGAMNMSSAANNATYAYHCRGLLFAEAHDTIVVPNLVTQYATTPAIKAEAPAAASLTDIPLISRTYGIYNALINFRGGPSTNATPRLMGDIYLYKDGRRDLTNSEKFTNVNVADAEVDWAYEFDPNSCTYYSTPYAVATYTGTNANIQGIESASANVSDLGSAVVKIDPQPETVASPSWTWSETATPPAAEPIETPICGGGSCVGTPIKGLLSTYCSSIGRNNNAGTDRNISTVSLNGQTITVNENSSRTADTYRGFKNDEATAIELVKGTTYTLRVEGGMNWTFITCFADWNADGDFSDTGENVGILPARDSSFNNDNTGNSAFREFSITVPTTATTAYIPLRVKMAYSCDNLGNAFNANPCALSGNETSNQSVAVDIVLKIVNTVGEVTCIETTYCTPASMTNNPTVTIASGFLSNLTANGTNLHTATTAAGDNQYQTGSTIIINQGDNLELNIGINSLHSDNLKWAFALAFVDLNGDGDFSDPGERIYEQGGTGSDQWTGTKIDAKPWNTTKTITFDASVTNSMLRIFTIGEYNSGFAGSTNGSMAIYNTGCNTVAPNGYDSPANRFHCYDFPIQITSTGTCKYVHDFGQVGVGDTVTYTMPIGEAFSITSGLSGTEFTATQNGTDLELTYTPSGINNHTDKLVINYGGNDYDVELTGEGVNFPHLTFQIGEDGGGSISTNMGKTTQVAPITFTKYHGELLTAVPQGPCAIEGWYVDEGTGFVKQTDPVTSSDLITPDFTYTGAESNVIVEVRFKFEDFEGDFGNSRFTKKTNLPFYISSITTTGGIVNVDATNVFTPATVEGGSAHLNYLTDQRLQTLTETLGAMSHDITVTVENADKIPANARLLCFIDYNYNGWFDFTSSADGLASGLSKNNELVYVGVPNGNASQTFTFTITNDNPVLIDKYGKTRMRFMVATYVDMYGLGPVNQYGNYQPRFDTDGDGVADAYLPLNDSNGSLYTPNNECRYENYINVADVNFEVVAYITATDTYTIEAGTTTRMGDLYIESVEDASGIHSGRIIFDKGNSTGSLQVEGNIVVRKRIYKDRWHHVAFPIAMQGSTGTKGICAVGANGKLHRLADANWVLATFDPSLRNADSPADTYNAGTQWAKKTGQSYATLSANTFYEFAADNNGGAVLGQDPVDYYWIQFHSEKEGFHITAKSAQTVEIDYTRMEGNDLYWNRNVFTIYNPYLSPIDVREITASVGWENITWKNAYHNRYEAVSAATKCDMPPYFGYWVQFTEGIGSGTPIKVTLGDPNRSNYASVDDAFVTVTPTSTTGASSSFDTPDAYTLGIDRAAATLGKQAASRTIVTLTDVGSVDEFRAGYDMPVSYADATSIVPEIWSKAGSSRMMFNDVMRDNEVVVPVGIRIKEAGEYVIRLTDTNFAESLVQLYDKQTGARVDLQRNGELFSYNFLADAGDADSRFDLIIIAPESMTDLEVIEQDEVPTAAAIYKAGSTLRIVNMPLGYTVSVCDVIGREVLHTTVVDADMQLELPNSQGVYLVNVRNEKGAAVQVLKLAR